MFRWFTQSRTIRRTPASATRRGRFQLGLAALEERTVPANIVVTNTADSGLGSLRQAVLDAGGVGRPGMDSVTFDPSVVGTIGLNSPIAINSDVMIVGPGAGVLAVSGNKLVRVFDVSDGAATSVSTTITGLTIKDGFSAASGAGIAVGVNDALTLDNVYLTGNTTSARGGALYFVGGGDLTVTNSTLSANSAAVSGGAIDFSGTAAGGSLDLRNATISGNSAPTGGGVCLATFTGDFALVNSTLVNNKATAGTGGGILRSSGNGSISLVSSIVYGNTTTAGSGSDASTTGTVNYRFSLLGNKSGITTLVDGGSNLALGTNPFIGALASNGGQTPTHALLVGSPAIDKGVNVSTAMMNDQRGPGYTRSYATSDIGAFEYSVAKIPTVAGTFAPVTMTGAPSYTFQLTFADDFQINVANISTGQDIFVTGPNGFNQWAVFQSVDNVANGSPRVATYALTPPGGTWDTVDNGTYTVAITKNAVYDNAANPIPAGDIGQFSVLASNGTFVVTNDLDSGAGSLRAALAMANAAVGTSDLITFDPTFFAVARTIALTTGELTVSDPVTIQGTTPALLTVSGGNVSRVFTISDAKVGGMVVNISGMTISGGSATTNGGAITIADESVSMTNVTLTGNRTSATGPNAGGGAIAITGAGSLTMTNSILSSNKATGAGADGGAIRAGDGSTIVLDQTYITGNSTNGDGGGVYVAGISVASSLTITGSTISNNNATDLVGDGGGVFLMANVAGAIRNSTVSGNTAVATGGGVGANSLVGTFAIQNSTITDNSAGSTSKGGGVAQVGGSGMFAFESTVISANLNTNVPDVYATGKASFATSALGSKTGVTTYIDAGNNLPIGSALLLGVLANNGGFAPTHLPGAGSPLFDHGSNPAALSVDQRGSIRVSGAQIDIGSVEGASSGAPVAFAGPFTNITSVGGTSYTIVVTYKDDTAVAAASLGNGDLRVTGPNGYNVTATFVSVDVPGDGTPRTVTYSIPAAGGTWDGTDAGQYLIALEPNQVSDTSANFAAGISLGGFLVNLSTTYVVTNANDAGAGSLRQALVNANLTSAADSVTFDPTFFATAKTIVLTTGDIAITAHVAILGTGASKLTVSGGNVSRIFTINDGTTANTTTVSISGMRLIAGKSSVEGGAIYVLNEIVNLTGVDVTGNSSTTGAGGGIYITGSSAVVTMVDCVVNNNTAGLGMSGGGIRIDSAGTLSLTRTTVSGNTASLRGGGIYFNNGGSLAVTDSTISGNVASSKDGGGVYFFGIITAGGITFRNSTVSGNTASGTGGGIALNSVTGTPVFVNSTITANTALGVGGGIARMGGTNSVSLTSTIVAGNTGADAVDLSFGAATNVTANASIVGVADSGNFTLIGAGNQTGSSATPLGAKLGALANNGGPTKTHALLAGSPALNTGSNSLGLTFDQRGSGFLRVTGGTADVGAVEFQPAPTVTSVVVNGGAAQRSQVTNLTVTFSTLANFAGGNTATAFLLEKMNGVTPVGTVVLTADSSLSTATQTVVRLTFSGPLAESFGSLKDGRYRLTVLAASTTDTGGQQLDGNGNTVPGDNYVSASIHRLYGDSDGDGDVDNSDFSAFRAAFGTNNPIFDSDADGDNDITDFAAFRLRFGTAV